ncbi:MAG: MFS transporter [Caldilineaceae bacterium]
MNAYLKALSMVWQKRYITWVQGLAWVQNRDVLLVTLIGVLLGFTIDGGIFSVIFNLYLLRLGFAPDAIGRINSAGDLIFAIVAIPVGMLGGYWMPRTVMIWGGALTILGAIATAAVGWLPHPFWQVGLMAGKSLLNIGLAGFYVNVVPFVSNRTSGHQRQQVFSAQSALNSAGGFFGALLGGALPGWYVRWAGGSLTEAQPYNVPLWIVVIAALLMFILLLLTSRVKEPAPVETHPSERLGAPNAAQGFWALFIVMTLVRFFQVGGLSAVSSFFNVYLDQKLHVDAALIGQIIAAARLMTIPAVLAVPWLSRRFPRQWVSVVVAMGAAICLLPMAFLPVWGVVGSSYVLTQVLFSMRYSSYIVYLMELTPHQQRGIMTGAGEMAAGLSVAVAAFVGGYLIENAGYTPLFLVGAASIVLGTVLFAGYAWWHGKATTR